MPAYITSPFKPSPELLVAGRPSYLWGSYNDRTGPTIGSVISDQVNASNTAAVVFQILSGNIPVVGALATIVGTANSGNTFNVTNAPIIGVTATPAGIITIQFAVNFPAQALLADKGQVIIPQPEVAETLANGASFPVAVPFQNPQMDQGRAITAVVSIPGTLPTTATVTLQQAVQDIDSEYADIATVISVTGGVATGGQVTAERTLGRFYRFNTTGVTGPASSLIAKILG